MNVNGNYNQGLNSIYNSYNAYNPQSAARFCGQNYQSQQYGGCFGGAGRTNPLEQMVQSLTQLVAGLVSAVQNLLTGITGGAVAGQQAGVSLNPPVANGTEQAESSKGESFWSKLLDMGKNIFSEFIGDSSGTSSGASKEKSDSSWISWIAKGIGSFFS